MKILDPVLQKNIVALREDFKRIYPIRTIIGVCGLLLPVFLIIDYFDYPSQLFNYMISNSTRLKLVFSIMTIIIIAGALSCNAKSALKIETVFALDYLLLSFFMLFLLHIILHLFIAGFSDSVCIELILCLESLDLFLLRIVILAQNTKEIRTKNSVLTLKDLYDGNIPANVNPPIQIEDTPVEYDLLGREITTLQICHAIQTCQARQSYVIGLVGDWGTGKSTLVKNSIKRIKSTKDNDLIAIDDFDPWLYGSQRAMLIALYKKLLETIGINPSNILVHHELREVFSACLNDAAENHHFHNLLTQVSSAIYDDEQMLSQLRNKIAAFLRINAKRMVVVVDDLDRANEENIIFLFKLIDLVFDIPGVIYILAYDKARIEKIFTKTSEMNDRFIEKIVNQEIMVPPVGRVKRKEIYNKCRVNLLSAYKVSPKDMSHFTAVDNYIVNHVSNPRQFIRMINTVYPSVFGEKTNLYLKDLFSLEAIHFLEPSLYNIISENSEYFISAGVFDEYGIQNYIDDRTFNNNGRKFFEKLFAQFPQSLLLLKTVFPYVWRYVEKLDLRADDMQTETEFPTGSIERNCRVCHRLYFDLYFERDTNDKLETLPEILQVIIKINNEPSRKRIQKLLSQIFQMQDVESQKHWFVQFQLNIDEILVTQSYYVIMALTNLYYQISDKRQFLALSSRSRAEYIIAVLLTRCSEERFKRYLYVMRDRYDRINLIYSISYWLASKEFQGNNKAKERLQMIKNIHAQICETIIAENINLYLDCYYHSGNIWGLYRYLRETNQLSKIESYNSDNIDSYSIYRLLWDITGFSISGRITYYINWEYFDQYIKDVPRVARSLESHKPRNKTEKFIYSLFYYCLNHKNDKTSEIKGMEMDSEFQAEL